MSTEELRTALGELNSERDAAFAFIESPTIVVQNAILIPAEDDGLVKVSDGKHVYIIDATRVVWVKIG